MLGNIKEFISVVHDGLSTNANIRQTLQEVQKVKYLFVDKQKHASEADGKVNFAAGGQLLEHYQRQWADIHENAVTNSNLADQADKTVLNVHETVSSRLVHARDFCQSLSNLPKLAAAVEECVDNLKSIQVLLKIVDDELTDLEDLADRSNMAERKLDHHRHLSLYKGKKLAALEGFRGKLAKENSEQSSQREKQQLAELQSRRDISNAAFNNDVARYLATGVVPKPSPPLTAELSLEQIQLQDDSNDLDKFLNS